MKKERKCRHNNLELYKQLDEAHRFEDTRYWGLFKFGKRERYSFGEVKIDPKRFQKTTYYDFTVDQLKIIKLYCIWNFIKHNSASTYKTLNERYPEIIYQKEKYEQGELALYFIQFSEQLIKEIIEGCGEFFKEYCAFIFNENYQEAQWNYTLYFTSIVKDEIENITNPLGLQWWDDID